MLANIYIDKSQQRTDEEKKVLLNKFADIIHKNSFMTKSQHKENGVAKAIRFLMIVNNLTANDGNAIANEILKEKKFGNVLRNADRSAKTFKDASKNPTSISKKIGGENFKSTHKDLKTPAINELNPMEWQQRIRAEISKIK